MAAHIWDDNWLASVLDKIPALVGERTITDLTGGLTNRNVRVDCRGGTYVVRCSTSAGDLLGINRDHEYYNTAAAHSAGVGPPVIDYLPEELVLAIGYIEGETLCDESFADPAVVERAARAMRRLHDGPYFLGRFDMFARQASYWQTVNEQGIPHPDGYGDHLDTFAEIGRALAMRDEGLVPCNNDLLAANFIDDGERVWLIDFEYAGANDACFELGNVWGECNLTIDQLEAMVTAYYGRPLRNKLARAQLFGIVAKYGWTLWGCIQDAKSPIDYDFWEWAMERYERAAEGFLSPELPRLLDDVQRVD